jgi:hypothetical protein
LKISSSSSLDRSRHSENHCLFSRSLSAARLLLLLLGKCVQIKRKRLARCMREKTKRDSLLRGAPIIACSWLL